LEDIKESLSYKPRTYKYSIITFGFQFFDADVKPGFHPPFRTAFHAPFYVLKVKK
jgi:hypothetical protein